MTADLIKLAQTVNVAETILAGGADDAIALLYGETSMTYAQLRAAAQWCADRLRAEGLAPGDRVGLVSENNPLMAASYLGAILGGFCAVPLPTDASDRDLRRMASITGMQSILVSKRFHPRLFPLADKLNVRLLVEEERAGDPTPGLRAVKVDPARHPAAIMFTSGSTGEPKGVTVSHRNIAVNTADIIEYMNLGAADRVMAVLPFTYCYGASLLHTHLAVGGSLVLNNHFMFPEKVLDEMQQRQCTGLAGVPANYQILLRKTHFSQRAFPAMRWLQQAGGKLPLPLIRELRHVLPKARLYVMYGQTEATARLSYLPPERLADKPGSIGRGLRHTRLEVLRADGAAVVPGSSEIGEIVASGENVAMGYWNDPEETAQFFRDGKLHTGDMATCDAEGFVYVVDRGRDFIKAMGNRFSPKEIEEAIAELREVAEVAVIGVPHEIWGECVKAYIVPTTDSLTPDKVHAHCLKRLPNYKIPHSVEFAAALPKTAHGKVDKEQLKRLSAAAPSPTAS